MAFTEQPTLLKESALLPPRLALGSTLAYHGWSKLKSAEAMEGNGQFFEQVGLKPGKPLAIATGITELASGILTLAGIGTRIAALGVLVTQGVAIAKVHSKKGFDITKQGMEFNLALCAMALALLMRGPGRMSAHSLVERRAKKRELRRGRFFAKQRKASMLLDLLG